MVFAFADFSLVVFFFSADPAVVSCRFIVLIYFLEWIFVVLFLLELFSEKDGVVVVFSFFDGI